MLLRLFVVALCLAMSPGKGFAETTANLIFEGSRLSAAKVKTFEQQLEERPEDMTLRTRLCAYYFYSSQKDSELRPVFRSHVLWLIERQPRADLLSEFVARLTPELDPEAYAEARTLWTKQIEAFPTIVAVQSNAANWFLYSDRRLAEAILLKIEADRPGSIDWPKRLAELYLLDAKAAAGEESRSYSRKAMEAYQRAYNQMPPYARQHLHLSIGEAALACGEIEIARRSGEERLKGGAGRKVDPVSVHDGNILLGRVALAEGKVEEAKSYLSAASRLSPAKDIEWMDPDKKLAADLLEKGEREAVLAYLKGCRVYWKQGPKRIDHWSKVIRDGGTPDWSLFEEEVEPAKPAGPPKKPPAKSPGRSS